MKVVVIIPAAGLGTRMAQAGDAARASARKPSPAKQFTEINGVPILIHTLRRFDAAEQVSEILVAMRPAEAEQFRPRLEAERLRKPIRFAEGGEHRQHSV